MAALLARISASGSAASAMRGTTGAARASRGLASAAAAGGGGGLFTADGRRRVTVARGDGIGPEIMDSTLRILEAAQAKIAPELIDIGEKVYGRGVSAGIEAAGWASLRQTRLFLKAPITTPLGGGVKSLNVTVRKTLGLYANVRPVVSLVPYVAARSTALAVDGQAMDVVIVRENEEDLYAGIEHRQTSEVLQCLKLISLPGCERIVRYAFEYARQFGRKRVTCMSKDNIMKLSDGAFHRVFERIAKEYAGQIAADHRIIDIGAAQLASQPHKFDVIVTLNLYGDIISDIAAEVAGSVGLAGSANIGQHASMFEAVHGSAPDIAGKDIANPSGLLNGAVSMLVHIGQNDTAATIKNAWLTAIEDGLHTADIYKPASAGGHSTRLVGTREFTDAVIARLGKRPSKLQPESRMQSSGSIASVGAAATAPPQSTTTSSAAASPVKSLVGVDVFVDWDREQRNPDALAAQLQQATATLGGSGLKLTMISNRGVKVWPNGFPETYKVDHWRCRFEGPSTTTTTTAAAAPAGKATMLPQLPPQIIAKLVEAGVDVVKTENLYLFDGEPGYSLGQGQ